MNVAITARTDDSFPTLVPDIGKVKRAAIDNPDLPLDFVRNLLIARAEEKETVTAFTPLPADV